MGLRQRQEDDEPRSSSRCIADFRRAAERLSQLAHDGETDPAALDRGEARRDPDERQPYALAVGGRDAASLVVDRQARLTGRAIEGDADSLTPRG